MVFDKVKINGKDTTLIYENYRKMYKIAHPDFEQFYSILRNMSKNFSPELLLELNLNSPIFSKTEHETMELRDELIQVIERSINEIGTVVTERYIDSDVLNFNISNGFLTPSITEQGLKIEKGKYLILVAIVDNKYEFLYNEYIKKQKKKDLR